MAIRPIFSTTDKANTNLATAGTALAAEFATQAFPESQNKRMWFTMRPAGNAVTTGATATELFIDGVQNFRLRVADRSTILLKALVTYNSSVLLSACAFEVSVAATNVNGSLTLLAVATVTKFGTSAATFSVNLTADSLTFTGTGVAGDTQGQWELRSIGISEVTDLG